MPVVIVAFSFGRLGARPAAASKDGTSPGLGPGTPAHRGAGEGAERPSRATVLPLGTQHLPCLNCFRSEGHWGPRQRPEGGQDLARTAQPCVRTAISTVTTKNEQAQGAATHGEKFAKDKHVSGRN